MTSRSAPFLPEAYADPHHASTQPHGRPTTPNGSLSAAIEVLRLLGFVRDMWNRHRATLYDLARDARLSEYEAEVVNNMGSELMEVWEMIEQNRWEKAALPHGSRQTAEDMEQEEQAEVMGQVSPFFTHACF